MSTDQVRKFAVTSRRNTDDHPLLEFNAPRQLFHETRLLNVELLYENKDGLLPEGIELENPERVYAGMVEPFLDMNRSNLASQAMGVLGQAERADDASLHLAIAQISFSRNDLQAAESELRKARESAKPGSRVIAGIEEMQGLVSQRLGNDDEAIGHFTAALSVEPRRQLPIRRLAEIYGARQDWVNGARWMEEYVASEPLALGHQYGTLGDYYLAGKDVPKALKALQTGIEKDPYTFWVHFRFARMFEEQKQTANAIRHYEIAARYGFDRSPEIYTRLGNVYKAEGRLREALDLLKQGRRIYPTNSEIYRLYRELDGAD
jgi:tetratricopeptide (TPR) repeat protein